MADIEFTTDEDKIDERSTAYMSRIVVGNKNTSFLMQGLVKSKIAKNDVQAFYILLGTAIVAFLLTLTFTIYIVIDSTQVRAAPEDIPPWLKEHIEKK